MLQRLAVVLFGLVTVLVPAAAAQDLATPGINYDFCTLTDSAAPADAPQLWGAAAVQAHGRELLHNPAIIDTPLAGYPLAYVALTHERDVQRCGGSLATNDRHNRLIGDLLADLMSRWLMLSVASCAQGADFTDHDSGICAAMERIQSANDDALKATVEMTAVYLTSHMGMALVAVVYDDPFWNQEFPDATHCTAAAAPCGDDVIQARLSWIRRYKSYYDLNNAFLSANLGKVIGALKNACYIRGGLIPFGAGLANLLPTAEIFGSIRDRTFAAALATAADLSRADHPMLMTDPESGLTVVQYANFGTFATMPAALREAETFGRQRLQNGALTALYRPAGSLGWVELGRLQPSTRAECHYFAP